MVSLFAEHHRDKETCNTICVPCPHTLQAWTIRSICNFPWDNILQQELPWSDTVICKQLPQMPPPPPSTKCIRYNNYHSCRLELIKSLPNSPEEVTNQAAIQVKCENSTTWLRKVSATQMWNMDNNASKHSELLVNFRCPVILQGSCHGCGVGRGIARIPETGSHTPQLVGIDISCFTMSWLWYQSLENPGRSIQHPCTSQ